MAHSETLSPAAVSLAEPSFRSGAACIPSLKTVLIISLASCVIFVALVSALRNYFTVVDAFGDNSSFIATASAIRHWRFDALRAQQFWGLPYGMALVSLVTGASERMALLIVCFAAYFTSIVFVYQLWGGWVASFFAGLNLEWLQRSFLGGSEPLFVALLFAAFFTARQKKWMRAALLASLSTVVRPLGLFALLAIAVTLVAQRDFRRLALSTLIGLAVGGLYVVPLVVYFGSPLANVNAYRQLDWDHGSMLGWPFAALIKGTILYPAPWTNLAISYGWIALVLLGAAALLATRNSREFARTHPVETIFTAMYVIFLYTYNSSYWSRGCFPRFAIPVVPMVLVALDRWIPKNRGVLWGLAVLPPAMAAASAIGIRNVIQMIAR